MVFDIDMINLVYSPLSVSIAEARKLTGRSLTATEKILYSHLWESSEKRVFSRGSDYVDFAPDRIACQDATTQMALLQFMQSGKSVNNSLSTTV